MQGSRELEKLFAELLNKHLARNRKSLKELLMEQDPSVELRNGSRHFFDRDELRKISELVPESFHESLMLPIYIELSPGLCRISGKAACILVSRILGRDARGDEIFISKAELRKIRRELRTATQYAFVPL